MACGSARLSVFYRAENMPVFIGVLWPSREEAVECTKGDITLAFCADCGLISNTTFDAGLLDYNQPYDNALDHSQVFRDYIRALAERLIAAHNLHDRKIVDIGCGNGQFLQLLCELGDNQGVGYDPSHDPTSDFAVKSSRVRIVPDFYAGPTAEDPVDFICCRHVFEHISTPTQFLGMLRDAIGNDSKTGMYFEVPNVMHALAGTSVWNIIYEHCAYYSTAALINVFEAADFDVQTVSEAFDDQFLGIEVYPRSNGAVSKTQDMGALGTIADGTVAFQKRFAEKLDTLHATLRRTHQENGRAVVWGTGARAVCLLNSLEDPSLIHCAVDINPNKHGKFVAGTGHQIVPPASLPEENPTVVIGMNEVYADEVSQALQSLGLQCELVFA